MATTERPSTATPAAGADEGYIPLGRVRENVLLVTVSALLCGAGWRGEWGLILSALIAGVVTALVTYLAGVLRR